MRGWLAILAAVVVTLTGAAGSAQEAIRVNVNLVTVAFTVRDADGALVDNLTKDDLEIVEDTMAEKIAYFARSADVPLTLRLIVDANGSREKAPQGDLEVFLKEVLAAKERAFLVGFGNHIRLVSDFPHSSPEMMEFWQRYEKDTQKFSEIGSPESRDLGTAFYDSIYYPVTEKLAREEGRKALLMFSDGEDNSSSHDMITAIDAAQGANVVVLYDSLRGESLRKIDGAESIRDPGDGPYCERDWWGGYRCWKYGSAEVLPPNRGGIANLL